jgi:N-acetylglucosamine repressor
MLFLMITTQKATRQHTREHNHRLVLKTIFKEAGISRADIARATHLTRTTVSDIVSDLIRQGLVEEIGYRASVSGKPPIQVSIIDDSRHLLCIDLSGDEFRGSVVNLRGKIQPAISLPLKDRKADSALALVFELIDQLLAATTVPLLGIGIGSPGLIDVQTGFVHRAVNLGWIDLALKDLLAARYQLPIYVANDSHVAALAEYTFGSHQHSNLVAIKLGSGIGTGIILAGNPYYGEGGGAGEIGHLKVVENGALCTCGNYGCLETVASSRAIVNWAQETALRDSGSILGQTAKSSSEVDLDVVLQAFKAGDQAVTAKIQEVGRYLGMVVASLISILNVNTIVVSGDLINFGEALLDAIKNEVKNRVLSAMAAESDITCTSLGRETVVLGASALVLLNELGLP